MVQQGILGEEEERIQLFQIWCLYLAHQLPIRLVLLEQTLGSMVQVLVLHRLVQNEEQFQLVVQRHLESGRLSIQDEMEIVPIIMPEVVQRVLTEIEIMPMQVEVEVEMLVMVVLVVLIM